MGWLILRGILMMRVFPALHLILTLLGVAWLPTSSWADSEKATSPTALMPGRAFPTMSLTDQHDKPVSLPGSAEVIVFANAKAVDEWANTVLAAFGQQQMTAHHLVYLSDIHRMPWMISKMIALPKLRERAYSVALIRAPQEPSVLAEPEKGCLNWVQLQSGKVASIAPVCTRADFKARIDRDDVARALRCLAALAPGLAYARGDQERYSPKTNPGLSLGVDR